MRTVTILLVTLLVSCSGIDPGRLPDSRDFERWARTCSADGAVSTTCLRAQAVAWALENAQEGSLLAVLAELWAWWETMPHAEEPTMALSGDVGTCPTSRALWRGYYAPSIGTWSGASDQVLGIWQVIFACVGEERYGDVVLDNGLKWSEVRRRFERQSLDGPGDALDCEPTLSLPVACEQGEDVAIRWSRSGDDAMGRADVFGYAAQCVARHGGEIYQPWRVTIGAPVEEYRTAGMYLALCGLDSIACPPADEAAGKSVLRALQ